MIHFTSVVVAVVARVVVVVVVVVVVSAATVPDTQHRTVRVTQLLSLTFSQNSLNSCVRFGNFHSHKQQVNLNKCTVNVWRRCHVTSITSHGSCFLPTQPNADCYQPNQTCSLNKIL
jgi:flagellar biosynthesis protein FlhB